MGSSQLAAAVQPPYAMVCLPLLAGPMSWIPTCPWGKTVARWVQPGEDHNPEEWARTGPGGGENLQMWPLQRPHSKFFWFVTSAEAIFQFFCTTGQGQRVPQGSHFIQRNVVRGPPKILFFHGTLGVCGVSSKAGTRGWGHQVSVDQRTGGQRQGRPFHPVSRGLRCSADGRQGVLREGYKLE